MSTGIECLDGRCGNRAGVDERLPDLKADIKDIVECWSQTDPRFQITQRYSRLSVPQVAKRLVRDKGYDEWELPSNETIRKLMHELGFKPRKVRKANPQKLPETDAIFGKLHEVKAMPIFRADLVPTHELSGCEEAVTLYIYNIYRRSRCHALAVTMNIAKGRPCQCQTRRSRRRSLRACSPST